MTNWASAEAVDDACEHLLDPDGCLDPECIDRREAEKAARAAGEASRV